MLRKHHESKNKDTEILKKVEKIEVSSGIIIRNYGKWLRYVVSVIVVLYNNISNIFPMKVNTAPLKCTPVEISNYSLSLNKIL